MTDRDLIGEKVVSKHYGVGTIRKFGDGKVDIVFESTSQLRTFTLKAFDARDGEPPLKCVNSDAGQYIQGILDGPSLPPPPPPPDDLVNEPNGDQRINYSRALPRSLEWLQKRVYIPRNEYFKLRGIHVTATEIIAISVVNTDPDYYVYHDRWIQSGVYLFSGEGKSGDQKETANNRALLNARHEQKPVRLLIFDYKEYRMTKEAIYYDQGFYQVKDYTYELDYGEDRKKRKEYKFELQYTVLNL